MGILRVRFMSFGNASAAYLRIAALVWCVELGEFLGLVLGNGFGDDALEDGQDLCGVAAHDHVAEIG